MTQLLLSIFIGVSTGRLNVRTVAIIYQFLTTYFKLFRLCDFGIGLRTIC